jgi:hypothetical protein
MLLNPIDAARISIDPYPFVARPLRVCYAYKLLATHDFPTEAVFLEAYYAAVPKTRYFEFV